MYRCELGPGCAHPCRLRLDIWSERRRNVRWVMTGIVIGRLWLTSDLEVVKGHGSLSRLGADVLSDHGGVTVPNEAAENKVFHNQHFRAASSSTSKLCVLKTLSHPASVIHCCHANIKLWQRICGLQHIHGYFWKMEPWFQTEVDKCELHFYW